MYEFMYKILFSITSTFLYSIWYHLQDVCIDWGGMGLSLPPTVQIKDSIRMISGRSWGVLRNTLLRSSSHILVSLILWDAVKFSEISSISMFNYSLPQTWCVSEKLTEDQRAFSSWCLLLLFLKEKKITYFFFKYLKSSLRAHKH